MSADTCKRGHAGAKRNRSNGSCQACVRERGKRIIREYLARLAEIKLAHGCLRCGYREHPAALSFHHRDPATKKFTIGKGYHAAEKLLAEIAKCDVLCENCHRVLHAEEKG